MGQKVHPTGLRLGYNKPWRSRWFAAADYAKSNAGWPQRTEACEKGS